MGHSFTLDTLVSAFNTLGQAASVAGVILIGYIADRFPKRALFVTLLLGQIAATASYYFLPAGSLGAIFTLEILGSFVGAPLPVLLWAMYADTADYGEWQSGRRTTALVFSASLMSQKIGWALAAYIAFKLLAYVGFTANIVPSLEVKDSLVHLMSIIPAVLGVASIITFLFYPLNDKKVAAMNAELKQRRAGVGGPA